MCVEQRSYAFCQHERLCSLKERVHNDGLMTFTAHCTASGRKIISPTIA
jgi:hypothetical protein